MSIYIPPIELVDIDRLKVDFDNPNRMNHRQKVALAKSLLKYGFIIPIITNKDLLIANGQQRLEVVQEFSGKNIPELDNVYFPVMKQVPVVRLPVDDVDRRLLRQVLNKLRGEHQPDLDALEFERLIQAEREEDLKLFLDLTNRDLEEARAILGREEAPYPVFEGEEEEHGEENV